METSTVAELLPEGIPQASYDQFNDVRGWLAHLLHFCMNERKYLKTKRGLKIVEEYQSKLPPALVINNITMWHTYLVMFVMMFHEANWVNVNLNDMPKLSDHLLLGLIKHNFFAEKAVDAIVKEFKLVSKERKLLKELALRLCPLPPEDS